jgi:tetratricopeptide (TPR) repeat protein
VKGIDPNAYECMRSYIDGNRNLEEGEISLAIFLYDKALAAASAQDRTSRLPRGSILMRRARAYLGRAANHRNTLRTLVRDLSDAVPSASTVKILYQTASTHPALSSSIFARLACDSRVQQAKFRQIRYRHDMYEFALLHAARDGLQSTQVLPNNAGAWLLAGECLAELRKLEESNRYYQRALEIDPSIGGKLGGVMEKNRASQEFLDVARASGFSGDTLRLAIDVAA